jgi:hypothetical protein
LTTLSRAARSRISRSTSERGSLRNVTDSAAPGSGRGPAPGSK